MSWKKTFGLDFVDTVIHLLVSMVLVFFVDELTGSDELALAAVGLALMAFAVRRRAALSAMPAEIADGGTALPAAQAAANDYFERRILELEERLEFAERLLTEARDREQLSEPGRG